MYQGQHLKLALTFAPPDNPCGWLVFKIMALAQLRGCCITIFGQVMGRAAEQQMADARQTYQLRAFFHRGDGAGGQPQQGLYLPERRGA